MAIVEKPKFPIIRYFLPKIDPPLSDSALLRNRLWDHRNSGRQDASIVRIVGCRPIAQPQLPHFSFGYMTRMPAGS